MAGLVLRAARGVALVGVVVSSLWIGSRAVADVHVDLDNGARVRSDLAPGEVESFFVTLPRGAELSVKATTRRNGKTAPAAGIGLRVFDGEGDEPLVIATAEGRKTKLTGFAAPRHARFRIEVTDPVGGGYQIVVKWALPGTRQVPADVGPDPVPLRISVEGGTKLKLRAKADRDSEAAPRMLELRGVNSDFSVDLGGETKATVLVPETDDYDLIVTSPSSGPATVRVKGKGPLPGRSRTDLSDDKLRTPDGFVPPVLFGASIGPAGGTVLFDGEADADMDGAGLIVGPSKGKRPTVVIVGRGAPGGSVLGDGNPLGPVVYVGPTGARVRGVLDVDVPSDVVTGAGSPDGPKVRVHDKKDRPRDVGGEDLVGAPNGRALRARIESFGRLQAQDSVDPKTNGAKFVSGDPSSGQQFGEFVATDGEYYAVSALDAFDGSPDHDSVYVYRHEAAGPVLEQRLDRPRNADQDFGRSIAFGGDGRLLVGAFRAQHTQDSEARGAVLVYRRISGTWQAVQRIETMSTDPGSFFGRALAEDDGVLAIGASEDSGITGSVHVYRWNSGTGQYDFEERLEPGTTGFAVRSGDLPRFGAAVAIDGSALLVGCPTQDATGDVGEDKGVAYVYRRVVANNVASWVFDARLVSTRPEAQAFFGQSVAVANDDFACTAPNQTNGMAAGSGAVFVFRGAQGAVTPLAELANPDPRDAEGRDMRVAMWESVLIVGYPLATAKQAVSTGRTLCYRRDAGTGVYGAPADFDHPDVGEGDSFGVAVAAGNGALVVGALLDTAGQIQQAGSAIRFRLPRR